MKLEHFEDGYEGEDVLLLYSGTTAEATRLREAVQELTACGENVALHDLEFVDSVGRCQVRAAVVATGAGVRALPGGNTFAWNLPPSDWERVVDLLEPFCQLPATAGVRFQYLHEHGGIQVIYSTAREW
jgi:hypothetical protein